MPIAIIYLNAEISEEIKKEIIKESMEILSKEIKKPINYCSTQLIKSTGGFGGEICSSAFIDIKSIGGLKGKQKSISDAYCKLLENKVKIDGGHIYLNFTEFSGNDWGYDHGTF